MFDRRNDCSLMALEDHCCLLIVRWVYTSDAVKRRTRRHTMRRFAALAGAVLQASTCVNVLVKSINPRAYKARQKLSDYQDAV